MLAQIHHEVRGYLRTVHANMLQGVATEYIGPERVKELVPIGGTDGFNNYPQRGSFHHIEETLRALVETFPMISRLKMLRQWGGIVDMTGDRSPIISKTPLGNRTKFAGFVCASRFSVASFAALLRRGGFPTAHISAI